MYFSKALNKARKDMVNIYREAWEGTAAVYVQMPCSDSAHARPYLCMSNEDDPGGNPWQPSHEDLFADDWCVNELKE